MRKLAIFSIFLLIAGTAGAASLDVNGSCALQGSYGLEVIQSGDTTSAFVADETPADEVIYRAQFYVDWNDTTFASNSGPTSNNAIFKLWDMDQPGPIPRQHTIVGIRLGSDGNRKLWTKIIQWNGVTGTPVWSGPGGPLELNLPGTAGGYPVHVIVEWTQGTSNDGTFSIQRATAFDPTTYAEKTHNAVMNNGLNVDKITFGGTGAMDATTTGSYCLDTFESYRTLAP